MANQKVVGDKRCKVKGCELTYSQHSGQVCPACYVPAEHHTKEEQVICWANRARMAAAIRDAGPVELHYVDADGAPLVVITAEMNDTDRQALKKCPHPDTLTEHGYQVLETS